MTSWKMRGDARTLVIVLAFYIVIMHVSAPLPEDLGPCEESRAIWSYVSEAEGAGFQAQLPVPDQQQRGLHLPPWSPALRGVQLWSQKSTG